MGSRIIQAVTRSKASGFTLVELVTTVVLLSILATLGGFLILTPITSFTDQTRRAALTDVADNALQRIARELRNALPNSVRIAGGGTALEFLNTSTGGRYRAYQESDGTGDPLVNGSSDTFNVLEGISVAIDTGAAGQANCFNNDADCLVLYNTGTQAGFFNAYNGDNIAAITAVTATTITYNNGGGFSFPFPIPPSGQQRFFVVDTPISYVCSNGQLWRYQNYTITAAQPTPVGGAAIGGVNPQLLANNVAACNFSYNSGAGTRHGLVTLRITVTSVGESVALLYQTHVSNIP
ncbi:MAG TPA: type II secretion system protein [Gammaproteobacteria bacterium]